MRIIISEFMDEVALSGFPDEYSIHYDPKLVDCRDKLLYQLVNADALIVRNRTQVDKDLIASAPSLKAIGRLGVGLDNIDVSACEERGIAVLPAIGANALSVMEYVIATAMVLVRGAYFSNEKMLKGEWPRSELGRGGEIQGRVMGLCGFGGIAQLVAERAKSLGMTIAAYDPYLAEDDSSWDGVVRCDFDSLVKQSDVLSLHLPLTDETKNMIDAKVIDSMKSTAVLINTSRGGVVDEKSLAEALKENRLAGASLDVFAEEPLSEEGAVVFAGCPNLILTPHVAGVTHEGNGRVSHVTVANVIRALSN
jgi:(S)-sulfolactate dehydrogenase